MVLFVFLNLLLVTLVAGSHPDSNIICPDKQGSCPSKSTCCKQTTGKYGCCPLPNVSYKRPQSFFIYLNTGVFLVHKLIRITWFKLKASCCSDEIHCCPEGFTCDVAHQQCIKGDLTVDWLQRVIDYDPVVVKNVCPGGRDVCPKDTTCCAQPSGSYGCCSFKNVSNKTC